MQLFDAAGCGVAMPGGDGADLGQLLAERSALLRVQPLSLGATAHQARGGERAGHGPITVGVENAKESEQIIDLCRLPVVAEELTGQPNSEVGVGEILLIDTHHGRNG